MEALFVEVFYPGELNHLPYLLSTSVSQAVIIDFSTNYMTALGLTLFAVVNDFFIVGGSMCTVCGF